ncbi:MAG TPA: ABC transporter substrate-binding protein, partial [Allosphingosinicella sp.]|nr:ABC transporter substrate-binding protein [Allosphingosinicella sp.]
WANMNLAQRRSEARRLIAELAPAAPIRVRVAMPQGPGYRLIFAYLRRDWRLIGVEADRVAPDAPAELRMIDSVAPAMLASWYLRHFACDTGRVCDPAADQALEAARVAPSQAERQARLAEAAAILSGATPFITLASPVRWSLVAPRLTGFRPNLFSRHPAGTLIAEDF